MGTPDDDEEALLRLARDVTDGKAVDWSREQSVDPARASDLDALAALEKMAGLFAAEEIPPLSPKAGSGLEPGRILGRFRVEREAGRGGMGVVYLAHDLVLERAVALKLLPPEVAHYPDRLTRFTREAKLLASLNHPNVATIHGLEEGGPGIRYLVLEWVSGETLARRLQRGPLPWREGLELCLQIARGVACAHEGNVIHRDLKPGNVMINAQGRVKVLDFGLARREPTLSVRDLEDASDPPTGQPGSQLSERGVAGTWGYASPECLLGLDDQRADIFAFACVLYECLTGRPAFPGPDVNAIRHAVLHEEPEWSLLPADLPETVRSLLSMGVEKNPEQRLLTMEAAIEILERALGRESPSAPEDRSPRAGFPGTPTHFVGREDDIGRCRELLETNRLLTLTGTGGCGKTRLAIQVASACADDFPGGLFFADLSPIHDPERVVRALATTLGIREDPSAPLLDRVVARLGGAASAGETLAPAALVVLDNCEQVLDACRDLVRALLAGCPRVGVLCTSREILRLPVEQVFVVPPLPVPTTQQLSDPSLVAASEAVRLFLDRLRAADPTFVPDPSALRSIGEICCRVEGLPLAVELAAARARVLSPHEIVVRLDRQLQILRHATGAPDDRHRTMHATIAWSAGQLRADEARVFRTLAVFSGGWDLESATRVCTESKDEFEALDLITRLVEKSLVVVQRTPGESSRYRYLEPIRQFALQGLLESEAESSAREGHARYFLAFAEGRTVNLRGQQSARALLAFDRDHENILSAIDACETLADGADMQLRFVYALHLFWYSRGHFGIGERSIDRALARVSDQTPPYLHALVLYARGSLVLSLGRMSAEPGATYDPQALRHLFRDALARFRALGDRAGIAGCLNAIGIENNSHGDYAAGRVALEEACEHFEDSAT